jgi:heptosyltransferase-3
MVQFVTEEAHWAVAALRGMELEKPIFIHPGAGAVWKRWPPDCFARLGSALVARGSPVALVAGPADEAAIAEVLEHASSPLPVVREPSVRRLAALLSQGNVFVGNDSGVTHLAAAAGTPTVALFGPTDPASWSPLGRVRVVRKCDSCAITPGQIRVCHEPACLMRIPVDAVIEAIDELLR